MLDGCFPENKIRRADETAAEFCRMNRMARDIIKNASSPSLRSKSIKAGRFRAAVDEDCLLQMHMGIEDASALPIFRKNGAFEPEEQPWRRYSQHRV